MVLNYKQDLQIFLFTIALPLTPSRTQSYRDKKDHSSSRRGGFDRPSYDRKSDRPAYEGPSMFGGRAVPIYYKDVEKANNGRSFLL